MPSESQKEERGSAGRDEAWFAKIDRDYEQHSALDMQSARDNQQAARDNHKAANEITKNAIKHYARLDLIAERGLTNAVTHDSERSERGNAHNMNATENMNIQNDTLFLLLAKALDEDGEATITVAKGGKKKA